MQKKIKKHLYFHYPVRVWATTNGKREKVLISTLEVEGTATFHPNESAIDERYQFEIDVIMKEAVNIKDEIEHFGSIHDIEQEALKVAISLFKGESIPDEDVRQESDRMPVIRLVESLTQVLNQTATN